MIRDPDTPIPQPIPDEDIYAEVVKTKGDERALRAFNTVLETYCNNLKERIEMKNQNETPQPEAQLPTTSEVEQNLPKRTSEDDYIDAMPFICDNVRLDNTRCENIIDTVDDLYAPCGITCRQCFNEYEAEKQRLEAHRAQQYRRVSFKKAQRLRDQAARGEEE